VPVTTQPARWASPGAFPLALSKGLRSLVIALLLLLQVRLSLKGVSLNELASRHFAEMCAP
jgi:hypothetical protein